MPVRAADHGWRCGAGVADHAEPVAKAGRAVTHDAVGCIDRFAKIRRRRAAGDIRSILDLHRQRVGRDAGICGRFRSLDARHERGFYILQNVPAFVCRQKLAPPGHGRALYPEGDLSELLRLQGRIHLVPGELPEIIGFGLQISAIRAGTVEGKAMAIRTPVQEQ